MRYETTWSGVQISDDGERLEVAAEPGLCSCASFTNKSNQQIQLLARFGDLDLGRATLAPGHRLTARFDWAGDATDEAYVIEVFGTDGQRLDVGDVVDARELPGSRPCSAAGCPWLPLNMGVVTKGRPQ
jgi:hypothetical protein